MYFNVFLIILSTANEVFDKHRDMYQFPLVLRKTSNLFRVVVLACIGDDNVVVVVVVVVVVHYAMV